MLGIACVIAGVYFISQTDHVTQREPAKAPQSECRIDAAAPQDIDPAGKSAAS